MKYKFIDFLMSNYLPRFTSDSSGTDSGFLITWSAVPGVPGCGGLLTQVQWVPDHLVCSTRGTGVWRTTYTGTAGS